MNKLDALIDACKAVEKSTVPTTTIRVLLNPHSVTSIRRVFEAVREDMGKSRQHCCSLKPESCRDCPLQYHAATRAALEDLA